MRPRIAPQFATEAELCAAFIAWAARWPEWTAYPESCGWDILLAHADGTQVGIQAKLKLNLKVLAQAVASWHDWHDTGPDFRALLVPGGHGVGDLCDALGLGIFEPNRWREQGAANFSPELDRRGYAHWHYTNPTKRHVLPKYVPDVPCGVPGPLMLTPWKIAALEIVATIAVRGFVTRDDFKRAGIDHRRWTQLWLEPDLKSGAWRANAKMPNFAAQHPVVYPQVLADVRDKMKAAEGVTC